MTPEEKLRIADMNINPFVEAWPYTPVGMFYNNLAWQAAHHTSVIEEVAKPALQLWYHAPLGWLVQRIFPIELLPLHPEIDPSLDVPFP